jgi:hypothetical protein
MLFKILVEENERKRELGKSKHRWEDNIKIYDIRLDVPEFVLEKLSLVFVIFVTNI